MIKGPISLAEICERASVSPRTVRYYEELGLLPGVVRRGLRRCYDETHLERLRFIQRLKALGLALQEIGELNAVYAINGSTRAMLDKLRELLRQHLADLETKVRDLQTLQAEMRSYLDHVDRRVELQHEEKQRANG